MDILFAILIGLMVGVVAKLLMPGRDPGGWIVTALLGIGGGVLGTVLGQKLHYYSANEPAGFVGSVLGAVLLLFVYRLLSRPSRRLD